MVVFDHAKKASPIIIHAAPAIAAQEANGFMRSHPNTPQLFAGLREIRDCASNWIKHELSYAVPIAIVGNPYYGFGVF